MDVDQSTAEEAMETDPPQDGMDHPIDPDGDEQMDSGEGLGETYDEEGDVEIAEGDELAEVDAEGDITPEEAEHEGEDYFYEEEAQAEEGDFELQEGETEDAELSEVAGEEDVGAALDEGVESKEAVNTVVEGTDVTTLTTPALPTEVEPAASTQEETVEEQQAEQGNAAVEPQPTELAVEVKEVTPEETATTELVEAPDEVVEPEIESKTADTEEIVELGDGEPNAHEEADGEEVIELEVDEEEEEEDGFEEITYDTLPPILLHLPNAQRALFNPILSEDGTTPLIWFAEKVQEFSEGTLSLLWSAIRGKLEEEGLGNDTDELVIVEKLTDLKMGDVSSSSLPVP